jgi:hypothetical protein
MSQNTYVDRIYGTKISARAKSVFLFMLRDEIKMAKQFSSTQCMNELSQLDADLIYLLWDKNYLPKTEWLAKAKKNWSMNDHNGAADSVGPQVEKLQLHQITWILKIKKNLLN